MTERPRYQRLARLVFAAFVLTFLAARILVLLIMTRRIPDLFLHIGGTHVHHLNYGIFLLSGVGAYMIFVRPTGKAENWATIIYGIGLGLTFDEFGMWLHLGGPYWQRASFDAVLVIGGLLGVLAFSPNLNRASVGNWCLLGVALLFVVMFGLLTFHAGNFDATALQNRLREIERNSPP